MLVPSHSETYCVALAEAQVMGVPAVAAFTGGTAWLVDDGSTGLFYPQGDERMCAWQIERVLRDPHLAQQLGRQARAVALERNHPDSIVNGQLAIYRCLLGDS